MRNKGGIFMVILNENIEILDDVRRKHSKASEE